MEAFRAISELIGQVLKLANNELASRYMKKNERLLRELIEEENKPVYYSDDFRYDLKDQAKIDTIKREMLIIKDQVIAELNKANK